MTPTQREAMEMALEALDHHTAIKHPQQRCYRDNAIEALRDALTEPVQEPVGEVVTWLDGSLIHGWFGEPPPEGTLLYTAPPRREWVGLTVEEIDNITDREYGLTQFSPIYEAHRGFAYAIEAKLKEKNSG